MKKTRYSETQIIKILNEIECGRLVKDVCREYGISDQTYYNWKSKYGGMTASDVKKLKELEDENRELKRMFADLSLKHEALKDIVEKSSRDGRAARAGGSCPGSLRVERAQRLRGRRHQPVGVSLPAQRAAGRGGDRGDPVGGRTLPGLWLQQGVHGAAA